MPATDCAHNQFLEVTVIWKTAIGVYVCDCLWDNNYTDDISTICISTEKKCHNLLGRFGILWAVEDKLISRLCAYYI